MTRYDARLALRTVALSVAMLGVALVVMLASDEGAARMADRWARLAALSPFVGGMSAWLSAAQARARGESLALCALGASPARAALGAVVGGAMVGALGAVVLLSTSIDLRPLFPAVPSLDHWRAVGPDALQDTAHGIAVWSSGRIVAIPATVSVEEATSVSGFRVPTAMAILLSAAAVPTWSAFGAPLGRRFAVAVVFAMAFVLMFHAVAARHAPASVLALPPILLIADAWVLHRAARWS